MINTPQCWEEVWQQGVAAHEPTSEVPAGKPPSNGDVKEQAGNRVFWFLSALDLLVKVYFILWDRKFTLRGSSAFFSSSFFPSVENISK